MDYAEINGYKVELDLLDVDVMEKYQYLAGQVAERVIDEEEYKDCVTEADRMRKQCRIVDDFFNQLFGEGTSEELFPAKNNLGKRIDAFGMITTLAIGAGDRLKELTDQYSPERINREQITAQKAQTGALGQSAKSAKGMSAESSGNVARALQDSQTTDSEAMAGKKRKVRLSKEQFEEALRVAAEAGILEDDEP